MPRGNPHTVVGIRVNPTMLAEVDKWAEGRGQCRSDAIKALLRHGWQHRAQIDLAERLNLPTMRRGQAKQ